MGAGSAKSREARNRLFTMALLGLLAVLAGLLYLSRSAGYVRKKPVTNSLGMEFVFIPKGTFLMGSPRHEPGRGENENRHAVTLTSGFYMAAAEVTVGAWKSVMGAAPPGNAGDDLPVTGVSFDDCLFFIAKLNEMEGTDVYRLPSEAEWEYAARAGIKSAFPTGKCLSPATAVFDGAAAYGACAGSAKPDGPAPVKGRRANAWDLYDMNGNVAEWCADWFAPYPKGAVTDPKGPDAGDARVRRGGSFATGAGLCRSAARFSAPPSQRDGDTGFRLARSLS